MARTQADRDDDLKIGRQIERKDAEIARLKQALSDQVSKIDAWAADTTPGNAADVLLRVGQIAKTTLNHSA